jgi:hypothetical protein
MSYVNSRGHLQCHQVQYLLGGLDIFFGFVSFHFLHYPQSQGPRIIKHHVISFCTYSLRFRSLSLIPEHPLLGRWETQPYTERSQTSSIPIICGGFLDVVLSDAAKDLFLVATEVQKSSFIERGDRSCEQYSQYMPGEFLVRPVYREPLQGLFTACFYCWAYGSGWGA